MIGIFLTGLFKSSLLLIVSHSFPRDGGLIFCVLFLVSFSMGDLKVD